MGGTASALVVGTGINVNHAAEDLPAEIRERATSLRAAGAGTPLDPTLLAARYLSGLGSAAEALHRGRWSDLATAWSRRAPGGSGRLVRVVTDGASGDATLGARPGASMRRDLARQASGRRSRRARPASRSRLRRADRCFAVDVGNTNITIGVFDGERLVADLRVVIAGRDLRRDRRAVPRALAEAGIEPADVTG